MLISRKREQEILNDALKSKESQFIAIYGRRRVGKTYLVRECYGDGIFFSHTGVSGKGLKIQLDAFRDSLESAGYACEKTPSNWIDAFGLLKKYVSESKKTKKIIFLDELSWMDTPRSNFLTALEFFWNGWGSGRKDIVLVVCASSTSWIINNLIHNKGGLYNRLTAQIHLDVFTLKECDELSRSNGLILDHIDVLEYYMAFGGVPFYWNMIKKGKSVAQNIDDIFFAKDAPLRDEYEHLYAALFKNPEIYMKIVKTLSNKKYGMTRLELIDAAKLSNSGSITHKLEELEQCGFIRKYYEYGKSKKNAIYQLIDAFTLFYFSFMKKRPTDEHFWLNSVGTPKINTWKGLAYEKVCLLHIEQIKKALGIGGVLTEVHSWYCKADDDMGIAGSQIDLLIVRKDRVINICEIKYSDSPYSMTKVEYEKMANKINDFLISTKTNYALYPTLIVSDGVKANTWSDRMQSVISADELFL